MEVNKNTPPLRIEHFKDGSHRGNEKGNAENQPVITVDEFMQQDLPDEYKLKMLYGLLDQVNNREDRIEILQSLSLLEKDEGKRAQIAAALTSSLPS